GHLYQVIRRLTEDADASEAPGRSRALPHALIVTEDAGLRAGLAVALRTRGRVDAVADTNAALSVLQRTRPDVVIVSDEPVAAEVGQPGGGGPEVLMAATRADIAEPLQGHVSAPRAGAR